jgi:hypothetical protein
MRIPANPGLHERLRSSRRHWQISKREIWAGLGIQPSLWEYVGMATKRTKADKAQRQADQLDKKSERRPEQETGKRKVRKDFSRAA